MTGADSALLTKPLKVAVLVDLPRSEGSGGHVKCWENIAKSVATGPASLDMTVYFSGEKREEALAPHVRFRQLPPIFSTARLKFLPYMPDTTDLAPYHARLAGELKKYDVIHTTDGYFAFAQTAANISRRYGIPLVTSFHTDTPSYARIFTRQTIDQWVGRWPKIRSFLNDRLQIPEKQGRAMEAKLAKHLAACRFALVSRPEDQAVAERILSPSRVKALRLGIDKQMFGSHRRDRAGLMQHCGLKPDRFTALFVGRVDIGKNIYTLIEAAERLIAEGMPLHVLIAGVGPAEADVKRRLGADATIAGYVKPDELARLYASVDVLTLTSEVEIRSMVGGEALVSGCPVLVSEKSGIAPLFDNTSAMQVVAGGGEEWAVALKSLMQNTQKLEAMRESATSYAKSHLAGWDQVLAEDLLPVWQRAYSEAQKTAV